MKASDRFLDNTTLSSYKDCPRRFFIRHVLNWRSEGTATPLVFGLAWHSAMDTVWQFAQRAKPNELAEIAFETWQETWESEGMSVDLSLEDTERLEPRTPGIAREMLHAYVSERYRFLQGVEVVAIEQPFAVPLPGTAATWYIGKLDKVFRSGGELLIGEHKTTTEYKRDGGFRSTYVEGWYSDSQIKGYQFGGQLFYPGASQVWIDAALVHKSARAFRFIPVAHQFPLLQEWVNDANEWVRRLTVDVLEYERAGELTPGTLPKNENSCMGKFGPCPFLDICRTTSDPSKLSGPPPGYMVEKWEPFDVLGLAKLLTDKE